MHYSSGLLSSLRNPMDCSMPGLSVPHHLPRFAQVHVCCISDVIQPSYPLMPSSFALNLSSIKDFSNESTIHTRWLKYWHFSFSISPSSVYSGVISLKIDWFDVLAVQGTLRSLVQHSSVKTSVLQHSAFFLVQLSQPSWPLGRQPWLYGPLSAEWCLCFSTHCLGLS